jgi:hypothetical protein
VDNPPVVAPAPEVKEKPEAKEAPEKDTDITTDPAAAAVLKSLPCKVEDWQCWAKLAETENNKSGNNKLAKKVAPGTPAPTTPHTATNDPNANLNNVTNPSPAPNTPPAPVNGHTVDPVALAALEREEIDDLNKRATKVGATLDAIRTQRESQGQHMPTDIDASRDKMKSLIAQADTAVAAGDIFNGQKFIDLAESELKKLERFAGH